MNNDQPNNCIDQLPKIFEDLCSGIEYQLLKKKKGAAMYKACVLKLGSELGEEAELIGYKVIDPSCILKAEASSETKDLFFKLKVFSRGRLYCCEAGKASDAAYQKASDWYNSLREENQ